MILFKPLDIHPALEYDADTETDSDICLPKGSIKPQRHKRAHKFIVSKKKPTIPHELMPSSYCDKALVPHSLSQLKTLNDPFL